MARHTFPRPNLQQTLRAGLLGLALMAVQAPQPVAAAEPANTARKTYSIAPGPLGDVLAQFAAYSGVPLSFDPSMLGSIRSEGLQGNYSVQEGFDQLLRGTGYQLEKKSDQAYSLRKSAAPAAKPVAAPQSDAQLPEVSVQAAATKETATGPVDGYAARRSATATKTDTPLSETPQSVTIVTRDQIVETGATTLDNALAYAAGVRGGIWGVSTRLDGPQVRGGEPTIYLDGLNDQGQYWTSTVRSEPYLLERIEVLRGPASMLFGQGTTAGVINTVSKQPLEEVQREIGLQLGSFDRYQIQADLTGPLTEDGTWLYRLVAVGRESGTQMDYQRDDRTLLAPSFTWRPSAATDWTFRLKYQEDRGGGDSGNALPWEGTILPNPNGRIPRSNFVGEPTADYFNADNLQLGWSFAHRFNEQWQFRQNLRWTDNEVDYAAIDAYAPYIDAAQRVADRAGYFWRTNANTLGADQQLEGLLKTGEIEHRLLFGFDLLRYRESGEQSGDDSTGTLPPIDVYSPTYNPGYVIPAYSPLANNGYSQYGFYAQDQMKWNSWILMAGLRHDNATNWEDGTDDREASANSKRFGLMYQFASGFTPYVSYAESFQPQANTPTGQRLDPLRGEQWEAGLRFEPANGGWRFQLSGYELREENRAVQVGLVDFEQTGHTENTGVEVEWIGRVTRSLDLNVSYTYTNVDKQLMATPEQRAAAWGTYRFSIGSWSGFSAGLGVQYSGEFTDGEGTPETPSVTTLDAMLGWQNAHWSAILNVTNLTDKEYFSNCWSWEACSYGPARNVMLTTTYRF